MQEKSERAMRTADDMLDVSGVEYDTFRGQLADWAMNWVDDLAVPVMKAASDLYRDKAIVKLVGLWADADTKYRQRRYKYLMSQGQDNDDRPESVASVNPYESARHALGETLYSLLAK